MVDATSGRGDKGSIKDSLGEVEGKPVEGPCPFLQGLKVSFQS